MLQYLRPGQLRLRKMKQLTKTRAQLEELGSPFIGIELQDGLKVFGLVDRFTQYKIYVKNKHGDIVDVPRRIIKRAFLLIKGDGDGGKEFPQQNKSAKPAG
jgi:hypothetical protein